MMRSRAMAVSIAYLGIALVVTWPLALHFGGSVVGDPQSDVWKHLWGMWWVRHCLVDLGTLPLYTPLLNYPYGGMLFFIDPVGAAMAFPLQAAFPPWVAYNAIVLFNMWLAAIGAYLLACYFSKNRSAAFVAGVIFGFSPYIMANITSGISESFNIGWVPLFILYYIRALRTSGAAGTANSARAGVLLALATLACWYHGTFCFVFAFYFFFYEMARLGLRLRRRLKSGRPTEARLDTWRRRSGWFSVSPPVTAFARRFVAGPFRRAALVAIVGVLLVAPFALAFKGTLNSRISLVYRVRNTQTIDVHLSEKFHNISHLLDYVLPGKAVSVRTYTVDRLTRVSYVGWLVLLLALLGLLTVRRRDVGWWGMATVGAVLLSLGPFLYVTPDIHTEKKFFLYMWMYDYFPFFSQISIPYRFNMLAVLGLAVLASYALAARMRSMDVGGQRLLALSVSLAVVTEVMLLSPAPFPLPLSSIEAPPVLRQLAQDPERCAVLDLPVQRVEGELVPGEYFYYQMLHGKGIPSRVEGDIPVYVAKNRFMVQLFHLEHDYLGYPNPSEASLIEALDELRNFRFKYVVVHENLMRAAGKARVHALLEYFLGPPRRFEPNLAVYDLYRDVEVRADGRVSPLRSPQAGTPAVDSAAPRPEQTSPRTGAEARPRATVDGGSR